MNLTITPECEVVAIDGQLSCDLEGEVVLLNLNSGIYYGLQGSGVRIWELIREPRRLNEILSILLDEYEVSREECEEVVAAFVQQLVDQGLAQVRAPG